MRVPLRILNGAIQYLRHRREVIPSIEQEACRSMAQVTKRYSCPADQPGASLVLFVEGKRSADTARKRAQ